MVFKTNFLTELFYLNGVKQDGVLSPILFAVYVDSLLGILGQSGMGCHIGGHFVGALLLLFATARSVAKSVKVPVVSVV